MKKRQPTPDNFTTNLDTLFQKSDIRQIELRSRISQLKRDYESKTISDLEYEKRIEGLRPKKRKLKYRSTNITLPLVNRKIVLFSTSSTSRYGDTLPAHFTTWGVYLERS